MKKIMLFIILGGAIKNGTAQHNVPNVQTPCATTAEGKATKFMTISYTIGEMAVIQSLQKDGLLITQGILQPIVGIADTVYNCFINTEVKLYPNPTAGSFSLQLSMLKKGFVQTNLFDAKGSLLKTDAFDYATFLTKQYNISNYASGQYYLQLFFTEAGATKPQKCAYTIQKIN